MPKQKRTDSGRKPKHSNDANRKNKGAANGMRDAATVSALRSSRARRDAV
jgi:hypothetical protein